MAGSPEDPAGALVEPELTESVEGIGEVNEIVEYSSPTYDLTEVIGAICTLLLGTEDPVKWVKDQIGGDTEGLFKLGVALGHIGQCDRFVAQNLTAAETAMFEHWHGNAANAAKGYFDKVQSAVSMNAGELSKVANSLAASSVAISALTTGIVTALESLGDLVIAAAVAAWVAGATAETGVGPVLAGGAFAVVCGAIIGRWLEVADKIAKIVGVLSSITAFILGADAAVGRVTLTPLPPAAYDNPQV
ncbi:hypothetical protein [Actinocrispum wychmicini]|uniref:Type VII secretion system (Wss) protein ESAT-6 n=1 Tax=Actinocrispum wychmicini TaxID=1213861 RepID=A0A4R2J1T3_9PSEU|nr:hypothetical protein [Actinocrispum wychmicini]TCO50718.1 hypothetical protein EV192_11396 [Actinocrispum wychmicini]